MAMESFYGGRQGASFVIVRSFDAIDNTVSGNQYVQRYYAVNNNNIYVWENNNFVERTSANYNDYSWVLTTLSPNEQGEPRQVQTTDGLHNLPIKSAEGMIQCFAKGGDTTGGKDGVNYGEYVIIDTPDKNNPDNGKVFRRGMDLENSLGGAEYIGQIVGPKGDTPKVDMGHYSEVTSQTGYTGDSFTLDNGDLIPGYDSTQIEYNDEIKYAYINVKDEYGNILGALVGFQIPYLVVDYIANSTSAYDNASIEKDPEELKPDGTWKHPFYQKWQLKIPKGIHGIDNINFEEIPSRTKPEGYTLGYLGAKLWKDQNCTIPYEEDGTQVIVNQSVAIKLENEDYSNNTKSLKLKDTSAYTEDIIYVDREDCYMNVIRYKEINYNDSEEGSSTHKIVGYANFIDKITLDDNGVLTAYYTAKPDSEQLGNIKWIGNQQDGNIDIEPDGTVVVYYNYGNPDRFDKKLKWIGDQQGNSISIDEYGTVKVYYNTGTTDTFTKKFKCLENVYIEDIIEDPNREDSGLEGSGDQQVHIEYNTGDKKIIGKPLNYIIEAAVVKGDEVGAVNAIYSHLLVYYSDKTKRTSNIKFPSVKLGKVVEGWVDLGDVRGIAGGLHNIKNINDLSVLYNGSQTKGNGIPPELLEPANPAHAGWSVTYTLPNQDSQIMFYDYNEAYWYSIGTISSSIIDPTYAIVSSKAGVDNLPDMDDPDSSDTVQLNPKGFWFGKATIKSVH